MYLMRSVRVMSTMTMSACDPMAAWVVRTSTRDGTHSAGCKVPSSWRISCFWASYRAATRMEAL